MSVRFEDVLADPFTTTIGTPQVDSLSLVLFAIHLEKAMRDLRKQGVIYFLKKILTEEAIYTNDVHFFSSSSEILRKIKKHIPSTIERYNINAKKDK